MDRQFLSLLCYLVTAVFVVSPVAAFCSSTGCATDQCSCMYFFYYCSTTLDPDGQCTLSQTGIWTIVGCAIVIVLVVGICIICCCCWCCRGKPKKPKEPINIHVNMPPYHPIAGHEQHERL